MMVGLQANNKLYGRSLYLLVVKAIEKMEGEVTNVRLRDHLVKEHSPTMNFRRRQRLLQRVQRATAQLATDGLIESEQREGTHRFTYNTYTIAKA